jgi:hypothetical protein
MFRKFLFILALIISLSLASGCKAGKAPKSASKAPKLPHSNLKLFSSSSPFNQKIPANPEIDPRSKTMIKSLETDVRKQDFILAQKRWTLPVYYANKRTSRYDVTLTADWAPFTVMKKVPIPKQAKPDPENDAEIAIIDESTNCEYDFWQLRKVNGKWYASWGNAISLNSNGIYKAGSAAARASGFALTAGIIWPEELKKGKINHALVFSYSFTKSGGPVPPATASDGYLDSAQAIPEGARLQLDPDFDISTLPTAYERTIAKALQEYGMFLGDSGGGAQLYALSPMSRKGNPYKGILPDRDYVKLNIPASKFRVLKMGKQIKDTPEEFVSNGCAKYEGSWRDGSWDIDVLGGYAYIANSDNGLWIVDISNPNKPKLSSIFDTEAPVSGVHVVGNYAYISALEGGLQIVDISNPKQPKLVGSYGKSQELDIEDAYVSGKYAYAALSEEAFLVIDISNPKKPVLVSRLDDTDIIGTPRHIYIRGEYAYLTDQDTGIQVINISNPKKPRAAKPHDEGIFPRDVYVSGNHAYVTDEDIGFLVIGISGSSRTRIKAKLNLPDFGYGIKVSGNYAYVANGGAGLQVIDISNPEKPILAGGYRKINGYTRDVDVSGNYAYVSTSKSQLLIIDVSNPTKPFLASQPFQLTKAKASRSSKGKYW